MESFGLLRTNVKLTTNIQIVVSSDYNLYMESFESNTDLSSDRFKKRLFNVEVTYDQLIPTFFREFPSDLAYEVRYLDDNQNVYNDYSNQIDDIYFSGCSTVDNTEYNEEFECLAPLHFDKTFPKAFVIFRVDNPGLVTLNKNNFKSEIVDKLKCVKLFDMKSSKLGDWIENSFTNNITFPDEPFDYDVTTGEFTYWRGIDYQSGGYTSKSFFIDDILDKEMSFFEMDKFITDGYKDNGVVYPNIINFKFLFDDTPATKKSLRKWSMNRYFGFYIDSMDLIKSVTPYSPRKLKKGITILENNIISSSYKDPFVRGFIEDKTYVEYNGSFYLVRKTDNGNFKIISPFDLKGEQDNINKNIITINSNNIIDFDSDYNTDSFSIENFEDADVWLINIDNVWHILQLTDDGYKINTDYSFVINNNKLEYFVNESDESFRTTVDLNNINKDDTPMTFPIYRLNFTDIKDFDTDIVNTDWASYEYEKPEEISDTQEPKLYAQDITSKTDPLEFDQYIYQNELVKVPSSSEYVATQEIFEVKNPNDNSKSDLSDIWRKNPTFVKWGYKHSIDTYDYPYRLNNSFYGEDLNRSVNVFEKLPKRVERNLDYFYTFNPDNNDYIDYSLHLTGYNSDFSIDEDFKFEIDKYFNVGTVSCGTISTTYSNSYFDYLFGKKEYLDNGSIIRQTKKYSKFNKGDSSVPNTALFRGIRFKMYDVADVITSSNEFGEVNINNISLTSNNKYEDWKLSVILSDVDYNIDDSNFTSDLPSSQIDSSLQWEIFSEWKTEEEYQPQDSVLYFDIIYKNISGTVSLINDPLVNPEVSSDWDVATYSNAFWTPGSSYSENDWVYNSGEYYYLKGLTPSTITNPILGGNSTQGEFYNPGSTYSYGDIAIYKNKVYTYSGVTSSNIGDTVPSSENWEQIKYNPFDHTIWSNIELWNSITSYTINTLIVYQGSLYKSLVSSNKNKNPITSTGFWELIYSFEPDTDKIYGTTLDENNIIELNNTYYRCDSNDGDTLDNGINIYVNKKWKNVLIHIYVNDNTMDNVRNANRDVLYREINEKLTANNFIEAVNDISNKRGFSDYISYYVIEEDSSYIKYSLSQGNIQQLPVILVCEGPESYNTKLKTLKKESVKINDNLFKPVRQLERNEINDISQINWYNGNPLGVSFTKSVINGFKNVTFGVRVTQTSMYRYNGPYMPIFKTVPLFKGSELCDNIFGNYKFDTELSNFGVLKEMIINKVNPKDEILKFKDNEEVKSIYPQLDEFGYTTVDHFIFKSTWDNEYYTRTSNI